MYDPAAIDIRTPERIARWRPLVQWFLAIPQLIIVSVLGSVASIVAFVSWFIVLFTGAMPQGIANLQAMILRYTMRTNAYAGFLHEEYPPFEFDMSAAEPGGTPVDVSFQPALTDRNRLTVGLRFIWAIPALLFAWLIMIVASIMWLIGFFAVLFTGRWPEGMRKWVVAGLRVNLRFQAYAYLLTDEYPPYSIDDGAADRPGGPASQPSPTTPDAATPPPPQPPPSEAGTATPPPPQPPATEAGTATPPPPPPPQAD